MNKKVNNLTIFGIGFVLITSGCSLKIQKDQDKFYDNVNKYTKEFVDDDYLVCAHRGFSSKEVENTSNSLEKANKEKYIDYIEMDVRMTQDKEFVLSHNEKLFNYNHYIRVSEIPEKILLDCEYVYNKYKFMTFGKDGKFKNKKNKLFNDKFKLISLEDGIKKAKDKNIILDLKFEDNGDEYITNFIKVIDNIDTTNITIQSKDLDNLKKIKRLRPNLNYSAIIDKTIDFQDIDEFDNITVRKNYINDPIVKQKIKEGKQVFVWTVNSPKSFYEVANYFEDDYDKVVYITDYPNEISYLLNDYKKVLKKTMK